MSLWERVMEDIDGIHIDAIKITDLYSDGRTIRFRTEVDVKTPDGLYRGQSYMKHPGNKTRVWPDYYKALTGKETVKVLDGLANSGNIQDIVLSTAVISAIYSPKVQSWPHKYEGDVTDRVTKGDSVLFVDNYRTDCTIRRPLNKFISKMIANDPEEVHVLKDGKIYGVGTATRKMTELDMNPKDISPDIIFLDNCFCPSIKQMDGSLTELSGLLKYELCRDVVLFGPSIAIDPAMLKGCKKPCITAYATSNYDFGDIDGGSKQHGKKRKMILML